jgi:hypothetical protein
MTFQLEAEYHNLQRDIKFQHMLPLAEVGNILRQKRG